MGDVISRAFGAEKAGEICVIFGASSRSGGLVASDLNIRPGAAVPYIFLSWYRILQKDLSVHAFSVDPRTARVDMYVGGCRGTPPGPGRA